MTKMKTIALVCAVVTGLAAAFPIARGVIMWSAGTSALAQRVEVVEKRLDDKIIQDRMDKIQERMWAMEDRWGERFAAENNRIHDDMDELLHFMTPEARDHYRELEKEYKELEQELKEGKKEKS